jgi:acyl carrier protein
VRDELAARLPEYLRPARYLVLDALPLTGNGKVDRSALPDPGAVEQKTAQPPAGERERALAAIWAEVLVRPDVGAEDNFFDLGGNSMLLARLQARLEADLDRPLPMYRLFEFPTVRGLARWLSGETGGTGTGVPDRVAGAKAARERARARRTRGGS